MIMTQYDYDLFVIGGGSGGVRAARVAAAHGARVALAEEHRLGGTCVIRGCVPKKLLVYGAHFAEIWPMRAASAGMCPKCDFHWRTLRDNVDYEVQRIEAVYQEILDNNGVETLHQRVTVTGPNELQLADGRRVTAEKILIAVGTWPFFPDVPGAEHGISSNEVFLFDDVPKRMAIAGGGLHRQRVSRVSSTTFGSDVTIVNRGDRILRHYDAQIRDRLLQISIMAGLKFRFNAPFERVDKAEDGTLLIHLGDGQDPIEADVLLFALGRVPKTPGLGLDSAGVELSRNGAVIVNADNQSTCPSIYAIGDVTDRVQLTPVAIREGQAFADTIFGGKPTRVDYENIPSAVFSHPPIGGVGMTEGEARNKLGSVKVYTSDFRPMKNVLAGRNERALYKMIVNGETEEVVGLHMIGPDAPEILQAAAVAVKAKLKKSAFDDVVAIHPTMAEELVLLK
jgi:glutathione reductase (NADPH)